MLLQKDVDLFYGKSLLLGVSGGIDSVCLLHYFHVHYKEMGISQIYVCHVNHGVRGKDSDADAALVESLCVSYDIPFEIHNIDPILFNTKDSFESKARELRYEILFDVQKKHHLDYILTAHHADDQAETLYMRLRRGSSLKGIQGILPKRNDFVVRPFLHLTKASLFQYAQEHHLKWREDLSNQKTIFSRNKTRLLILPYLESKAPGITSTLSNIASLSHQVYPKILEKANQCFTPMEIAQEKWPFPANYSPYQAVWCLSSEKMNHAISKMGNGLIEILRIKLDTLGFYFPMNDFLRFMLSEGQNRYQYKENHIEKTKFFLWFYSTAKVQNIDNLYLFEKNKRFSGEWRYRKEGDRFTPPGSKYKRRKLKQWLQEKGIPLWIRDFLPLLAQEADVLWIPGVAVSGKLNLLKGPHDESKNSFTVSK